MTLPKAANYAIVIYIICSVLYTSIYLLGMKGGSSGKDLLARQSITSLQQRYAGKQIVNWTDSAGNWLI